MSRRRIAADAGWVVMSRLPRGPTGRALCRRCSQEVPRGRQTFCGPACVHEHKIRANPGYVRRCVEARDQGVCRLCGVAAQQWRDAYEARIAAIRRAEHRWLWRPLPRRIVDRAVRRFAAIREAAHHRLAALGIHRTGHLWEADHIVPVVEGGGECGLDGYRTLCRACHRRETAALAARRAHAREAR